MSVMRETMPCPCGHRDATYAACCGRLHAGMRADGPYAQQAEELMRSRYSAFAVQDASYLLATWAPDQRPATLDFDVGVKWLGLTIRDGVVHDACHAMPRSSLWHATSPQWDPQCVCTSAVASFAKTDGGCMSTGSSFNIH